MAEDKKTLQPPLPLHGLKSKQCAQRLAGTGSSEHQQVLARVVVSIKSTAKQLNQLLLPLPWSDHRGRRPILHIKTE